MKYVLIHTDRHIFNLLQTNSHIYQLSRITDDEINGTVSSLVAYDFSDNTIRLTWASDSTNEHAFTIERSLNAIDYTEIGSTDQNVLIYYDNSCVLNVTYYYRIRARRWHGYSPYSNVASATATVWHGINGDVAIERQNNDYILHMKVDDQLYWSCNLKNNTTGLYTLNSINENKLRYPAYRIDQINTDITYGGTWVGTAISNPTVYHLSYARADVANSYYQWTSPDITTGVMVKPVFYANLGIYLVAIDGNNTLADLLPTAQELVDGGNVPNTILISNGGTLNPTDRCIDGYANADAPVWLSKTLSPGIHTIRITNTGYKNNSSGGARLTNDYISYIIDSDDMSWANYSIEDTNLLPVSSVLEYAFNVSDNGSPLAWVGNTHGYDNQTSITFSVDGEAISIDDENVISGKLIEVTRNSNLISPDDASVIALSETTYRLDPIDGLRVGTNITWLTNLGRGNCFPAMYSFPEFFDKGSQMQ